jgi:hypothetical protein
MLNPDSADPTPATASDLTGAERLVAHLAFPVIMGGAVAMTMHQLEQGRGLLLAFAMALLPAFGAVIVLERLVPYHREWNRSHRDFLVDLRHLVTISIFGGLIDPALRGAGALVATWTISSMGSTLWPTDSLS